MTAHKFLYKAYPRKNGTFKFVPREEPLIPCKIVVVDEVSMLPKHMWELLLSHHVYVIACGDPGQLPPIGEDNGVLAHPHIFLTQIMRQAQDNGIIRLSMDIRNGKWINPYKNQNVNIVRKKDFVDGMLSWADQIICGKNLTRYRLNELCRRMKWKEDYADEPIVGDKIICLRNNWEVKSSTDDPLINGQIGHIAGLRTQSHPLYKELDYIDFVPDSDEGQFSDLLIDHKLIVEHEPTITENNYRKIPKIYHPQLFDYGYCITAHKSQGSEYPKVLVFEEMIKPDEHKKWLYTAVTRASEKLTLVLNR